ncbi:MAG: hypothetical protein HGA25_01405 [Clostridiales bacterium]|nr:hypothetical protein [Clostridiales bacterium]
MTYLYAISGFVLLFGGGELLVRGAVAVSKRFGLSPLLIGMTVVAWCTSAPELVVSMIGLGFFLPLIGVGLLFLNTIGAIFFYFLVPLDIHH